MLLFSRTLVCFRFSNFMLETFEEGEYFLKFWCSRSYWDSDLVYKLGLLDVNEGW